MGRLDLLSFKVGQVAESKSFLTGYRGAWFRCKIKEMRSKNGYIAYALEFFDFPDENVKWTKLYQVPVGSKEKKRQLMVRPRYPPMYHESQVPHVSAISEVTVIVDGVWKVGDLVDWWTDGCYWSGRVTQILGNDKFQVELPSPPVGEGLSYEVSCKDLRPSLDWSPEYGWSVPISLGDENCRCARLIQPVNQASSLRAPDDSEPCRAREMPKPPLSIIVFQEATHAEEANMDLDMGEDSVNGKTSESDSVSSSLVRDASTKAAGHTSGEDLYYSSGSLKKLRTNESIPFNSMCSDTLEAAILDLEELANKVKWLKGILEFGIPSSNDVRAPWKFVEHRASSTPK